MAGSSDEYQSLVHGTTTGGPSQPRGGRTTQRCNDIFFCGIGSYSLILILSGIIIASLLAAGFTVIKPGEVGIVVTLGRASTFVPGAHFRIPGVSYVHTMSTKTQLLEQQNVIPTKEGLAVQLDTAV